MSVGNLSPDTIEGYIRGVVQLQNHSNRSLESLTPDDVLSFLYNMKEDRKLSRSAMRIAANGIRYFYTHIVPKNDMINVIPYPKKETYLPEILMGKELKLMFDRTDNIKHRAVLKTVYSAGLRRAELQTLRVEDVDSKNMQLRIRQGKGKKDRYALLSENALKELREYYLEFKPEGLLFFGRSKNDMISESSLAWIVNGAVKRAVIKRHVSLHTLRHSFASHLLSMGTDIFTIKQLLGHEDIRTTMLYLHVNRKPSKPVISPLDVIYK